MNTTDYLNKVAYIAKSDIQDDDGMVYLSKFDNSYITRVGMEENIKYLADREITEELTHGVGFSPKDNKWYGWSHRAIYGFTIGSTCKKGDCHYVASTPEELIDDHAEFFRDISDESAEQNRKECQILPDRSGIRILPAPIVIPVVESIQDIEEGLNNPESLDVADINEGSYYIIECGKGEWTAKTMEDAKQMAIDFNKGVS